MSASAPIVGRERELEAVHRFLHEPAAGPTGLVIEGEAGIGKTRIVRAALDHAASAGLGILRAHPDEGEQELPYAGLGDLFEPVPAEVRAALPPPQRVALEAALARGAETSPPEPHALSRAVLELLRTLSADGRLLLVIDDAQWLDRPTSAVLGFALRRVAPSAVRVLVAVRADMGTRGSAPPLGLGDWGSDLRRLEVGPLSATELGGVLASALPARHSRPWLEALGHAAGGNPMFALELARAGWSADGAVTLPPTLSEALRDRIEALDPAARTAVAVASAMLQPSLEPMLRSGVDDDGVKAALLAGILEVSGLRVSFTHPLLATAAYERLLAHERRDLHARLAEAADSAIERGHHVSRSATEPSDFAVRELDGAAGEAAALGDHAGAASFLLRAAELSPEPDGHEASQCRVRAASELALAGDTEGAAELAASVVAELPPGPLRAQARHVLASATVGSSSLGLPAYVGEVDLALADAEGDDELAASLHLAPCRRPVDHAAVGRVPPPRPGRDRAGRTRGRRAARGRRARRGRVRGLSARPRRLRQHGAGLRTLGRGPALGRHPVLAADGPCLCSAPCRRVRRGDETVRRGDPLGGAARFGGHRSRGARPPRRGTAPLGGVSLACAGARTAMEHTRQSANPQGIAGQSFNLAFVEAVLGNHEAARSLSSTALGEAESSGDVWYTLAHRAVLGLVALAEDDAEGAITALEPAWALIRDRRVGNLSIFPVAHVLAEAYVDAGRVDDAAEMVRALRESSAGGRPWSVAMAGRCDALIASATGDEAAARAALESALAAHDELREPFELARTLLVQGRVERRAKRRAVSREALSRALDVFDHLGARAWAEKTAAELARIPGRRRSSGGLTETERQVAELVAGGLSNKEVAARLFVSVRAVEANLSKVYAKLGVRSRTQVAGRLDR